MMRIAATLLAWGVPRKRRRPRSASARSRPEPRPSTTAWRAWPSALESAPFHGRVTGAGVQALKFSPHTVDCSVRLAALPTVAVVDSDYGVSLVGQVIGDP